MASNQPRVWLITGVSSGFGRATRGRASGPGIDAVDAISDALEGAKAELAAWERVGRSAVFDDE